MNSWIEKVSVVGGCTLQLTTVSKPARTVREMNATIFNLCRELELRSPNDARWIVQAGFLSHAGSGRYSFTVTIEPATSSDTEASIIADLLNKLAANIRQDSFYV